MPLQTAVLGTTRKHKDLLHIKRHNSSVESHTARPRLEITGATTRESQKEEQTRLQQWHWEFRKTVGQIWAKVRWHGFQKWQRHLWWRSSVFERKNQIDSFQITHLFCPDLLNSTQYRQLCVGVCVWGRGATTVLLEWWAQDGDAGPRWCSYRASQQLAFSVTLTWGEPPGEKPWLETGEVGDWLADDPTLLRYWWREAAWCKRIRLSYWRSRLRAGCTASPLICKSLQTNSQSEIYLRLVLIPASKAAARLKWLQQPAPRSMHS